MVDLRWLGRLWGREWLPHVPRPASLGDCRLARSWLHWPLPSSSYVRPSRLVAVSRPVLRRTPQREGSVKNGRCRWPASGNHWWLSTWRFGLKANVAALDGASAATARHRMDSQRLPGRAVEADPEVTSVGYGGLPDACGQVSWMPRVMLSPELSAGRGLRAVGKSPHPSSAGPDGPGADPLTSCSRARAERFLAVAAGFDIQELRNAPLAWRSWRSWIARATAPGPTGWGWAPVIPPEKSQYKGGGHVFGRMLRGRPP